MTSGVFDFWVLFEIRFLRLRVESGCRAIGFNLGVTFSRSGFRGFDMLFRVSEFGCWRLGGLAVLHSGIGLRFSARPLAATLKFRNPKTPNHEDTKTNPTPNPKTHSPKPPQSTRTPTTSQDLLVPENHWTIDQLSASRTSLGNDS